MSTIAGTGRDTELSTADTGPLAPPTEQPRHRRVNDTGGPGTTTIEDAVVQKIASRLVGEVAHVGGAATRVLGIAVGSESADRSPKVTARVDGTIVTLDVRLSLTYPAPVGRVTREVRDHVIERLDALTGLSVRQVDITVAALSAEQTPQRRLT